MLFFLGRSVREEWRSQGNKLSDTRDACRILFVASLANVPNAVLGLSIPELVAYLCAPGRNLAKLKGEVLERLATAAWYLHSNRDGKLFFRNVENLNAKLESLARTYVFVYNTRYLGSVEDRVHQLLSNRLQDIYTLFGQVSDVLEDVWIDVALGEVGRAKSMIASVPKEHPFDIRYQRIAKVDWESCERVLSTAAKRQALTKGW